MNTHICAASTTSVTIFHSRDRTNYDIDKLDIPEDFRTFAKGSRTVKARLPKADRMYYLNSRMDIKYYVRLLMVF